MKNIRIIANVDGVTREVELTPGQIYMAGIEITKYNDVQDVENFIADWFPSYFDDLDDATCKTLLERVQEAKEELAKEYRRRLDRSDEWFFALRDIMFDTVKDWTETAELQKEV